MELSSHQEATGEIPIPIPINSAFSHHHMIHHHDPTPHHIIPASNNNNNGQQNVISSSNLDDDDDDDDDDDQDQGHHHVNNNNNNNVVPYNNRKMVRYKECLKNHAASMGGNATDGCGEFMPSGEEGTIEALNCSACNCHRNFHRKEIEGEPYSDNINNCNSLLYTHHQQQQHHHHHSSLNRIGSRKVILGHPHKSILPPEALGYPTRATPHQMIMSYNIGGGGGGSVPSESDEMEDVVVGSGGGGSGGGGGGGGVVRPMVLHHHNHHQQQVLHAKKRHRTKFSQEQKDKMLNFAEKVGWKIQKQEESVVQQFCQEIGVKRRVLKVWMHNNKHNLAKKLPNHPLPLPHPPPPPPSTTTA
ncbi:hypothetical protein Dsin_032484 [Dipteronia sinensis]|uniref:ZF-HD dimerization-type domain-containing protein n=1 Tax=Dipteronia sinensis TaxID=43782 RepID=A0AAD9ZN70_9ROSI|nr:hypothetical protein Dsin_032484 [Dipteronia sinensis]